MTPYSSRTYRWPAHALAGVCGTALVVLLAGCSADGDSANDEAAADAAEGFPVTVDNCGEDLEFDAPPEQVLSLAQPQTDMMMALGVEDRIVGIAQRSEPDGLPGSTPDDELAAAVNELPVIEESGVPAKEVVVSAGADLVLAPSVYEYSEEEGHATEEDLQQAGAVPYLAAGGCPEQRLHRSVEDPLTDVRTLGQVLDVEASAEEAEAAYQGVLDEVADAIEGHEPVPMVEMHVFGDNIEVLAGSSEDDLVTAAGGHNVFSADDPGFDGNLFATLSAEVIAAEEPEAVLFSVGSEADAEAARELLRERFPTLPAVENDLLIAYSSTASMPGSLSLADAVREVAEQVHPDAF